MQTKRWIVMILLIIFILAAGETFLGPVTTVHMASLSEPVDPAPRTAAVVQPVMHIAIGLTVGLFGLFTFLPLLNQDDSGETSIIEADLDRTLDGNAAQRGSRAVPSTGQIMRRPILPPARSLDSE